MPFRFKANHILRFSW